MKRTLLIFCLLCSPALAVVGDFTADGCVDFSDLAILAEHWLTNDSATQVGIIWPAAFHKSVKVVLSFKF